MIDEYTWVFKDKNSVAYSIAGCELKFFRQCLSMPKTINTTNGRLWS